MIDGTYKGGKTFWVRIHIGGPLEVHKQTCREFCLRNTVCVTVTPTLYIYNGAEETGAIVELVQYPRFPAKEEAIWALAESLGEMLLSRGFQRSYLLQSPERTVWRGGGETSESWPQTTSTKTPNNPSPPTQKEATSSSTRSKDKNTPDSASTSPAPTT